MSCQQMSRFLTTTCTPSELAANSITTPEDPYVFTDTVSAEPPTLFIAQKSRTRFADTQFSPPSIEETAALAKATTKKLPLTPVNGNAKQITPATTAKPTATAPAKAQASSQPANANGRNSPSVTATPTCVATNFKNVTQSQLRKSSLQQQQQLKRHQQRTHTKSPTHWGRDHLGDNAVQTRTHEAVDGYRTDEEDEAVDCLGDDADRHDDALRAPPSTGSLSSEEDDGGNFIRSGGQTSMRLQHTPSLWQTQLLLDTSSAVVSPPTSPASLPSPTGCMQTSPLPPCMSLELAPAPPASTPLTSSGNLAATLPPSKFHSTTIAQHLRKVQCIKKSPKKTTTPKCGGVAGDVIEIGSVVSLAGHQHGGDEVERALTMLPTPSPPPHPLQLPQLEPFKSFPQPPQHSVSDLNEIPVNVIFRKPQTTNEITRQILATGDDCDVVAPRQTSAAEALNSSECAGGGENVHLQKVNGDGGGDCGDIQMATIPSHNAAMVNKLKNVKIIAPPIRSLPKLQPLSRLPSSVMSKAATANATRKQQVQEVSEVAASSLPAAMPPATSEPTSSVLTPPPGVQMSSSKATAKRKNGLVLTNVHNNTPASSAAKAPKPPKVAKKKPTCLETMDTTTGPNALKKLPKKSVKAKRKPIAPHTEESLISDPGKTTESEPSSCPCAAACSSDQTNSPQKPAKALLDLNTSRHALAVVKVSPSRTQGNDDPMAHENHRPYCVQQQWLSRSYCGAVPLGPCNDNNREDRISVHKTLLRRQALQLLATRSLQKLPILNARRRLMCVDRLLHKYENHNQKEISSPKNCIASECSGRALLMSSYCQLHITQNQTQQLFLPCSECRVPVFDIEHERPLCPQHAIASQSFHRAKETTKSLAIQNDSINNDNNNKYPQEKQAPSNMVGAIGTTKTSTAAARKRKYPGSGNPIGRPSKRGRKPLHATIATTTTTTPTITTTTAASKARKTHKEQQQILGIANGNSNSSTAVESNPSSNSHSQYGGHTLGTSSPPALAPLSGLGGGMRRMLGFGTDNSSSNPLAMANDLKEHEIQQIVTQFAMASNFNGSTLENNNYNNYNNNNTFDNNNKNINFNFNMIDQKQHQELSSPQQCANNTENSISAFMNTNSNSNFTSVFSSSSSLPSNDDFLSQDMLSICDNSSAYASSEDTGFGGLSETELKCGDGGIGVGGDGSHDADDITLLEEQDLANMFNALPVDSIMNELFNTVRPDERDEVERALEVVDSHLKSLQQKIGSDDSDFLGDFLDVSDQILADADMEIVSSVMHSPSASDCLDTAGPFPDVNRNTTMEGANGWPTANDIRGLLQT